MTREELEERRETCKVRNKLGYCNELDERCPKCKVHDYEMKDLVSVYRGNKKSKAESNLKWRAT